MKTPDWLKAIREFYGSPIHQLNSLRVRWFPGLSDSNHLNSIVSGCQCPAMGNRTNLNLSWNRLKHSSFAYPTTEFL